MAQPRTDWEGTPLRQWASRSATGPVPDRAAAPDAPTTAGLSSYASARGLANAIDNPLWLSLLFAVEALIVDLYQLPVHLGFDGIAFGDPGLNLTVQFLIRHGYRPGVDFGYPYGPLSLLFGKLWFAAFGMNPVADFAAVVACDVVFALGLARLASRLRLRLPGLALMVVGLPFSVLLTISFAHALERVFLAWALAEQAAGRRANALALATAAVFAKPSMGFVYGLLLLIGVARRLWLGPAALARRVVCELAPAALLGAGLFAISGLTYGVPVALRLVLPIVGARMYHVRNYGFFTGVGSGFWYFPGVHVGYYFGTVVAFWFAGTLCLIAGGSRVAMRMVLGDAGDARRAISYEIVLFCALMHVAFVTLFFGSNASWVNYVYVLVAGLAAMSGWGSTAATVAWALVLLGAVGQKGLLAYGYHGWFATAPSPQTAGLWAPADERGEWAHVLDLVSGHRAVLLDAGGAPQLLRAGFEDPVVATLIRGQTTPSEFSRALEQLTGASIAVVPDVPQSLRFLEGWPEFRQALAGWHIIFKGRFFIVYERPAQAS